MYFFVVVKQETDFWSFLCEIDLTLVKPFNANDSYTYKYFKTI